VSAVDPVEALLGRARALEGVSVAQLARSLGVPIPIGGVGTKGRVGALVERALGATSTPGAAEVDFPALGVELKTLPIGLDDRPLESTFVCAMRLDEDIDWEESWVRRKLERVLFVPVVGERRSALPRRTIGRALLWRPNGEELAQLRADYDEIVGLIGLGRIEDVTARIGVLLQLRPKAADGSKLATVVSREGDRIATVARGFYLRASFTATLVRRSLEPPTPR
jgi:DNA mismatch repair protein MutH